MVRKGDDTNAFGFRFLEVELANPDELPISKAEVRIGVLVKTIENPVFPLDIELSREETIMLSECGNQCYLAVYDMNGLKYTCENEDGAYSIKASPKVV